MGAPHGRTGLGPEAAQGSRLLGGAVEGGLGVGVDVPRRGKGAWVISRTWSAYLAGFGRGSGASVSARVPLWLNVEFNPTPPPGDACIR